MVREGQSVTPVVLNELFTGFWTQTVGFFLYLHTNLFFKSATGSTIHRCISVRNSV